MSRRAPWKPSVLAAMILLVTATLPSPGGAQVPNQPPSVEIDHPGDGAMVRGSVDVSGNASDVDGEVERVELRIDDGEWREANGTSPWNTTWNTTLWSSGNHTITARSYDGTDHSENVTINVTVDQAPTVNLQAPENGTTVKGVVNVTGTAEDPENGLENVTVRVDDGPWQDADGASDWWFRWNTTEIRDGNHSLIARADDGNATHEHSINVTVDNDPNARPHVTILDPPENTTVRGEVNVTGTADDVEGPVEEVHVRIDDGPWIVANGTDRWWVPWDSTNASEGNHTITARADDGNLTGIDAANVTVDNRDDDEAPEDEGNLSVEITEPEEGAHVNGTVTVRGTAQAPDGEVDAVQVRVDDGPWQDANGTATWTFRWNASDATLSDHTIHAKARSGNMTSPVETRTVKVAPQRADHPEGPWLEFHEPMNGTTVTGEFQVSGSVHNASQDVERVQVRLDEGPWITADGVANWSVEINSTAVGPGVAHVNARVLTGSGTADTAWLAVEVEGDEPLEATSANASAETGSQAPTLTLESPEDRSNVQGQLTFAGTVEDPDDEFVRAEIRIDGGAWRSVEVATGQPFRTEIALDGLEPGEHEVTVRAADGDEVSSEQTLTITVEDDAMLPVPGPGAGLAILALSAALVAGHRRRRAEQPPSRGEGTLRHS